MIIAVGYRTNSQQATKFRIWATKILREYLIKGFAMDDERLKFAILKSNLFIKSTIILDIKKGRYYLLCGCNYIITTILCMPSKKY